MLSSIRSRTNEAVFIYSITQEGEPGRFIEIDDEASELTGYQREEIQQLTPLDIFASESPEVKNQFSVPFLKENQSGVKTLCLCKDGRKLPVEIRTHLFYIRGEPIGFLIVNVEDEKEQPDKFSRVLSSLGKELSGVTTPKEASLVILNAADKIFSWDAGYISIYSQEDDLVTTVVTFDTIDGKRQEVPPPFESGALTPTARRTLTEGALLILREECPVSKDSEFVPFGDKTRCSASLMFVPIKKGEKPVGVLSIQSYTPKAYTYADLEKLQILADHCSGAIERTLAESKLRQSEAHLRLLTEQIPALLWTTDTELRFTQLCGTGFNLLNLDPQSLVGKSVCEFFQGDNPSSLHITMHQRALQGEHVAYETIYGKHIFETFVEPLRDLNGATIGCIGVAYDITQRKRAQEALRKFKLAIESTESTVIITDKDLRIEYVNPAFEKLTGYSKDEAIGKTPEIIMSGKHTKEYYDNLLNTIFSGNIFNDVIVDKKKNGELFYHDITITPLKDETGNITGFVETGKDVTERIRAEESLRKAHEELERRVEERTKEILESNILLKQEIAKREKVEEELERSLSLLRATLESTTDGILAVNRRGEIVNYNQNLIEMWQIPKSLIESRDFKKVQAFILGQIKYPQRIRRIMKSLEVQDDADSFNVLELKRGNIYECYSKPQRIGGKSVGRVWSFRDVTARKQSEEALIRSEAIYREAIENASGIPYRMYYEIENGKLKHNYEFIGEGFEELFGFPPSELTMEKFKELVQEIVILDPEAPPDLNEYSKAFRRGEVSKFRVDFRIRTPAGAEKWVSDCSVPIRDKKTGKVIGSLGILQDITLRKQLEKQARIQQEHLIQADKLIALGRLVSGVAHEINNPNNFIMLNTPVLLEAWESIVPILEKYYKENGDFLVGGLNYSEMREHIPVLFSGILNGAKRIKEIVRELKDFARKSPPELMEEVDINAVVRSAIRLVENMIKKSTRKFTVEYGANLPKIKGNFQRLEQVVINLVHNACQALPDTNKGIFISTSYKPDTTSIEVKVRDEGIGMPESVLKHIFDPFFTTKRDLGGTGLGLSISANIINEHNGKLELFSKPGEGTTAVITLPVNTS